MNWKNLKIIISFFKMCWKGVPRRCVCMFIVLQFKHVFLCVSVRPTAPASFSSDALSVTTKRTSRRRCSGWEYTFLRGTANITMWPVFIETEGFFSLKLSLFSSLLIFRDASWELVPNAYSELLEVYKNCDAVTCLSNDGRTHSAKSGYSNHLN